MKMQKINRKNDKIRKKTDPAVSGDVFPRKKPSVGEKTGNSG